MEKDLSSAATAYDLLRAKLFSPLGSSSHVDTSNFEEDFKVLPESRKIAFKCVNEIKNYSCLYLFNFHKYLTPSPFSDKVSYRIIDIFFFFANFSTVHDLLQRTILHGEGNSLLVIGPRGCCKSWVSQT